MTSRTHVAGAQHARAARTQLPPLRGLVLIGGRSQRMGRDKWALRYGERTQAERMIELLAPHCADVQLSLRAEQATPELSAHRCLFDRFAGLGPLSGILTAMHADPEAAWLVVACDLPFLDDATLRALVRARSTQASAIAFRSSHDGLPEPLCAVYEPSMRAVLERAAEQGLRCPRKILIRTPHQQLTLDRPDALDNVNTPGELEAARARLSIAAP